MDNFNINSSQYQLDDKIIMFKLSLHDMKRGVLITAQLMVVGDNVARAGEWRPQESGWYILITSHLRLIC